MGDVTVRKDVPVEMRDGVRLAADLFLPAGGGQAPVLLQRTAYDKTSQTASGMLNPVRAASEGYAVVVVDSRGRYASEGEFEPFFCEIEDGYDTVEWCAAQDWSDGNVGMYGMSYVGATQWLAAISAPPHLRALFPVMTAADYYDGWVYQGGAFYLAFVSAWVAQFLAAPHLSRMDLAAEEVASEQRRLMLAIESLGRNVSHLPLRDLPMLAKDGLAPYFFEWLQHPHRDAYWDRIAIRSQHEKVAVPAFNVGGWHDLFIAGPVRNFAGLQEIAATQEAREGQRLLMGPWTHNSPSIAQVGQRNFGFDAMLVLEDLQLRWFDHWLRERDSGLLDGPGVRYYAMNGGWRHAGVWPPAGTEFVPLFLSSGGRANSLEGDGVLGWDPPADGLPPDRFAYDPMNPVRPAGPAGIFDQRKVEAREDVLVYTSSALDAPLEIAGPVRLVLHAASSAPDTDIYARLVDVAPDGYAANVCDGIIRARFRTSDREPSPLEPGAPFELTVDMLETANVFRAGHRVRLEVTSSCFPKFDRNPNTGEWESLSGETQVAEQQVFHDAGHPSHLLLPVSRDVRIESDVST